jgi:hypothetical protein
MASVVKLLWHEKSNFLAISDESIGLPLLTILDDEYEGINPFYAYPLEFLKYYSWIVIGVL